MVALSRLVIVMLSISIFFCLYRAVRGPTISDRIMAVNVIGIKAVTVFVLLGVVLHESLYFDVAMAYIALLYIATIALMKYLDSGRLD